MSKNRYVVVYNDEAFPQIVPCTDGPGLTLLEAKDELYRYAAEKADHWRMVARAALAARKDDVLEGSIYTGREDLGLKAQTRAARALARLEAEQAAARPADDGEPLERDEDGFVSLAE